MIKEKLLEINLKNTPGLTINQFRLFLPQSIPQSIFLNICLRRQLCFLKCITLGIIMRWGKKSKKFEGGQ